MKGGGSEKYGRVIETQGQTPFYTSFMEETWSFNDSQHRMNGGVP